MKQEVGDDKLSPVMQGPLHKQLVLSSVRCKYTNYLVFYATQHLLMLEFKCCHFFH